MLGVMKRTQKLLSTPTRGITQSGWFVIGLSILTNTLGHSRNAKPWGKILPIGQTDKMSMINTKKG